jgi:hypothetical protein
LLDVWIRKNNHGNGTSSRIQGRRSSLEEDSFITTVKPETKIPSLNTESQNPKVNSLLENPNVNSPLEDSKVNAQLIKDPKVTNRSA